MRSILSLLESDQPAIGHLVTEFATPGIGHLLANSGCDFTALDMEHSGLGLETIRALIRYCEAAGIPALVRPPSSEPALVSQVLDTGAQGVMLPMIEGAEQMAGLVAAARYAPEGSRGVAAGIARDRYRRTSVPMSQHLAQANAQTVVLAIIESSRGVENVEAIAATKGLDGLIIGHGDLSVSLGQADDPAGEIMMQAQSRIIAAGRAHGRVVAAVCATASQGRSLRKAGITDLILGSDVAVYQGALTHGIRELRAALA
ncbi:MAG: hypothetical protein JJU15_19360 [Pararhodobacter sp.]|nr:hypothetical protein [Pararhodobacter sp.]